MSYSEHWPLILLVWLHLSKLKKNKAQLIRFVSFLQLEIHFLQESYKRLHLTLTSIYTASIAPSGSAQLSREQLK